MISGTRRSAKLTNHSDQVVSASRSEVKTDTTGSQRISTACDESGCNVACMCMSLCMPEIKSQGVPRCPSPTNQCPVLIHAVQRINYKGPRVGVRIDSPLSSPLRASCRELFLAPVPPRPHLEMPDPAPTGRCAVPRDLRCTAQRAKKLICH